MAEWITGWKKIAQYLDVSERTAQRLHKKEKMPVYKGTRANPKELDKFVKDRK
jgi:hypothetical protein